MAETSEQELDEDGLIIQKYDSVVLVVVPPEDFGDQILRYARSSLYNIHVGTWSVSGAEDGNVKGRLQDEFLVDAPLEGVTMDKYSGLILVGCEGVHPYANDATALSLVRAADQAGKLIGTWGNGLAVLANAGVLKGHKVTGRSDLESVVKSAGAKYTGRETASSAHVITARDEGSGMRFGQALVEAVRIL